MIPHDKVFNVLILGQLKQKLRWYLRIHIFGGTWLIKSHISVVILIRGVDLPNLFKSITEPGVLNWVFFLELTLIWINIFNVKLLVFFDRHLLLGVSLLLLLVEHLHLLIHLLPYYLFVQNVRLSKYIFPLDPTYVHHFFIFIPWWFSSIN